MHDPWDSWKGEKWEKIYKTVENSGVMNVVAQALAIAVGSVCSGERDTASDYSEKAAFKGTAR